MNIALKISKPAIDAKNENFGFRLSTGFRAAVFTP